MQDAHGDEGLRTSRPALSATEVIVDEKSPASMGAEIITVGRGGRFWW